MVVLQIYTPIVPTVIMLSLGGERLTPKVLDHYLHHDLVMLQINTLIVPTVIMLSLGGERLAPKVLDHYLPAPRSVYVTAIMVFLWSFTHLRIHRSTPKFNQFFTVLPRTPP